MKHADDLEWLENAARAAGFGFSCSRRGFLRLSTSAVAGLAAFSALAAHGQGAPLVVMDHPSGLIMGDPTRCVGCGRCELACTEFNDGRAQPALARIKVSRNMDFGPEGPGGDAATRGSWGNGLVIQETCRQCPAPAPCVAACPNDAIVAAPVTGAWMVDVQRCVGCRLCQQACPWGMMSFDEDAGTATKCFLCAARPKCVDACPAEALRHVPWRDLTTPPGQAAARHAGATRRSKT